MVTVLSKLCERIYRCAANKAQARGTDLSKHTYLVRDNKTGTIKDINWEAYNRFVSRSKAPGAFDSRSNDSGENNLFGTSTTDNNHFTITALYTIQPLIQRHMYKMLRLLL